MTYTQLAVVAVLGSAVLDLVVLRTRVLTRRAFWAGYPIVLGFQLLTNGVLTGLQVVRYDPAATLGVGGPVYPQAPPFLGDGRIAFAPVEDLMFGFALLVQAVAWWVFWGRRGVQRERPTDWRATAWGSRLRRVDPVQRRAASALTSPGTATDARRAGPTETRRSSTR